MTISVTVKEGLSLDEDAYHPAWTPRMWPTRIFICETGCTGGWTVPFEGLVRSEVCRERRTADDASG